MGEVLIFLHPLHGWGSRDYKFLQQLLHSFPDINLKMSMFIFHEISLNYFLYLCMLKFFYEFYLCNCYLEYLTDSIYFSEIAIVKHDLLVLYTYKYFILYINCVLCEYLLQSDHLCIFNGSIFV